MYIIMYIEDEEIVKKPTEQQDNFVSTCRKTSRDMDILHTRFVLDAIKSDKANYWYILSIGS